MMKSFFKKLASVLALAMVVSLAAPAAQTAAAAEAKEFTYKYQTGIGADVKTVNLAKTGDTVDLKFIGIPDFNNYETQWMSYGTGFTLDQSGVITATADAGEGVVWLSVGDDQTYVSDPIKVTIGELKATIGTQDKSNKALEGATIKVNEKMDLAFYGITDWNLGKYGYKWVVGDTSVLDVDQKTGIITGLKTGETTVTFLAPNKFNQANVVVTNALTVTVLPDAEPAIEGKQISEEFFYINFTDLTAANYDVNDIDMVRVFPADRDTNGNGIIDARDDEGREEFFLKTADVNKEENRLEVTTYADFVDGATYEITIGDYKNRFVASVGEVDYMVLTATAGYLEAEGIAAVPAKLSVKLYDKNGIDVTNVEVKGIKNSSNVTFDIADHNKADINGNEVTFYEAGTTTAIAYFDYYNITERKEATCTVGASKHAEYIAEVVAWKVINDNLAMNDKKIDWNVVVANNEPLWVASEDENYVVVALLKDNRGNYFTTHEAGTTAVTTWKFNDEPVYLMSYVDSALASDYVFAANGYYLEFATLNPDNLLMYADGEVVTYKETVSAIKLNLYNYYDESVKEEIATVPLTVKPARYRKYLTVSSSTLNVVTDTENDAYDSKLAEKSVSVETYDQYAAWWSLDTVNYKVSLVENDTYGKKYTDAEKTALKAYISDDLVVNRDNSNKVTYIFDGEEIRNCLYDSNNNNYSNRSYVTFQIAETKSDRHITVKVYLQVPEFVADVEVNGDVEIDTTKIAMDVNDNIDGTANAVNRSAFVGWQTGWAWNTDRAANITLYTLSKNFKVGFVDEELPVFNGSYKLEKYDEAAYDLSDGAQMLVVTRTNGAVITTSATGGAYDVASNRPSWWGAQDAELGVVAEPQTADDGSTYYTYKVVVAAKNSDGSMAYMPTGRYTVQVRTIKLNSDGETFTFYNNNDTKHPATVQYFNVTDTNDKITYAGQISRDLRESADTIEEVVAYAFNFNRNGGAWLNWNDDARYALQQLVADVNYEVGDGYVYIKSVTFKVPIDQWNNDASLGYYFYKVNVGSSVKVSTDLFFEK